MADEYSGGGFLSPDLEKRLLGDIEGVDRGLILYREYFPTRDVVEYTMYFKTNGEKHRVDFEVDYVDLEQNKDDMEDFIMRKARAAIMEEIENG